MKTKSFLLGAAALMLAASCSNDEVVNVAPQSGAIGFSSFVNNSTRATDKDQSNLTTLEVWGTTERSEDIAASLVFNHQLVSKETETADESITPLWSYTPVRYWIPGNSYKFAAIAPSNAAGVSYETNDAFDAVNGLSIKFSNEDAKANEDVLFATATATGATNAQTVGFNLRHLLSRVKFQFKNDFASPNTAIVVKDVKITDATSKATITIPVGGSTEDEKDHLWTADGNDNFTIPFTITTEGKVDGGGTNAATSETHYLIPLTEQTPAYNVTFTVELYNKDAEGKYSLQRTYNHKAVIEAKKYINNYSYTFTASINEKTVDPENELKPIIFDVTSIADFDPEMDVTLPKSTKNETPAVGEESNENN